MTETVVYLQLLAESELPDISTLSPFRSVIICENEISAEWQSRVSSWLVQSGCLYMMAWGRNCSSWDTSVDIANIELFEFDEIPDDKFVMTTWHDDTPLGDAFWFSKNVAFHPVIQLRSTVLLHIVAESHEQELMELYSAT